MRVLSVAATHALKTAPMLSRSYLTEQLSELTEEQYPGILNKFQGCRSLLHGGDFNNLERNPRLVRPASKAELCAQRQCWRCLESRILVYSKQDTRRSVVPFSRHPPTRRPAIFGLETRDLFLLALTVFVAFWTARAALARGKNPWVWGIAALVLGLLPFDQLRLLALAPVLYLMVFVRPTEQRPRQTPRNTCSKCASPHSLGQNFCTKCGWELAREYTPDGGDTVLASEMHQPKASSTATMERPQESPSETSSASPPADSLSVPVQETSAQVSDIPPTQADPGEASTMGPSPEPAGEAESTATESQAESETEEPVRPWGIPQPGPAPTAETMTARGAALLSEGKLQEAIDQFTKAIALDPKHREAFERRAEAYTRQGRGERAEEDYRHIQALNAGS